MGEAFIALGAVVAAAAAVAAVIVASDALTEARSQKMDSVRPVLSYEAAVAVRWEDYEYLEVVIRNVGIGPALEVQVDAWSIPVPDHLLDDSPDEILEWASGGAGSAGEPDFTQSAPGLAVGESRRLYMMRGGNAGWDPEFGPLTVVAVRASCRDVYQRQHGLFAAQPSATMVRFAHVDERKPELPEF